MVAESRSPYGNSNNNNHGSKTTLEFEKSEETKLELTSIVAGVTVYHKSFGEGTVTKLDKAQKHIRVKFSVGEKTFVFPDAFKNGFLRTSK